MKIYILTKGSYSDYHIITATTNKQRAKELQKIYSDKWEEANIEEFDDNQINEGRLPYNVYDYADKVNVRPWACPKHKKYEKIYEVDYNKFELYTYAKNKDEALKIFQDKKAQYLAEKEGI